MNKQQRRELRVTTDINMEVNQIVVSKYPMVLPKILPMQMHNISVGGVLLFCYLDLGLGLYFCSTVTIDGVLMNIVCESLRKEMLLDGYYYGCKLRGLTMSEQQVIRHFVFQEQMRFRRLMLISGN